MVDRILSGTCTHLFLPQVGKLDAPVLSFRLYDVSLFFQSLENAENASEILTAQVLSDFRKGGRKPLGVDNVHNIFQRPLLFICEWKTV